jgi:hypothetical protein
VGAVVEGDMGEVFSSSTVESRVSGEDRGKGRFGSCAVTGFPSPYECGDDSTCELA